MHQNVEFDGKYHRCQNVLSKLPFVKSDMLLAEMIKTCV